MTQPTEKRFVMEPRLDAEVSSINDALSTKANLTDPRLSDQRIPLDNSVTSAKIANGAIVNEDVNASAAIAATKIAGTAVTQADTGTVTSTMIANGTIIGADIASETITSANILNGTIVDADVNTAAAIAATKIAGTAVTQADTGTVTSTMILNGTIVDADVSGTAAITSTKVQGTLPVGGTAGQILAKNTGTNFDSGWINNFAPNVQQYVKNETASTMYKGQAVYIAGADNSSSFARVALAQANAESTSSKTLGLLAQDLAPNAFGYVITEGLLEGMDTSTATAGNSIWLSGTVPGGRIYGAPPTQPMHGVYLGVVLRVNANTGKVYVKVQNGYELDELHNVLITTPANGQALTYDSATQLWKNATPVNSLAGLSDVTFTSPVNGQVIKYDSATGKWINGSGGGGGGVTAQATAPLLASSSNGDAWFNTTDGTLYVCFVDVDSTKQWVQVQANSALGSQLDTRVSTLEAVGAGVIKLNPQIISANYSIPAGNNGMSAGPITISDGVVVTIPSGSAWSIV